MVVVVGGQFVQIAAHPCLPILVLMTRGTMRPIMCNNPCSREQRRSQDVAASFNLVNPPTSQAPAVGLLVPDWFRLFRVFSCPSDSWDGF